MKNRCQIRMCIPEEFKTFHFTRAAIDILNKMKELNSELNYIEFIIVYSKRKLLKLKYMKTSFFTCNK